MVLFLLCCCGGGWRRWSGEGTCVSVRKRGISELEREKKGPGREWCVEGRRRQKVMFIELSRVFGSTMRSRSMLVFLTGCGVCIFHRWRESVS